MAARPPSRILIISLRRIGDLLLTTPVIRSVRRACAGGVPGIEKRRRRTGPARAARTSKRPITSMKSRARGATSVTVPPVARPACVPVEATRRPVGTRTRTRHDEVSE